MAVLNRLVTSTRVRGGLLALAASAGASAWAGIDCERATTPQEIAICSNAELLAFDDYLATAYADLRQMLPGHVFEQVRQSQREWIRQRDQRCGADVACLMDETRARTAALNGVAQKLAQGQREQPVQKPQDRLTPPPVSPQSTPQMAMQPPAAQGGARGQGVRPEPALSPTEIYRIAAQSVVVVVAYIEKSQGVSQGSGVVIAPDTVATNCHVVQGAPQPMVMFQGNSYEAELVAGNADMDYCVLRTRGLPAQVAQIDRYTSITPGQRVYSIGSPRGFELTIAEGLVSGLREQQGVPMIQTSAAISPGSSGGGLFNEQGRVIGITTFLIKDSQNINFALPVELAEKL